MTLFANKFQINIIVVLMVRNHHRESTDHVHGQIFGISERKTKKIRRHIHNLKYPKCLIVVGNLETRHHTATVKGTRIDFRIEPMYMSGFLRNPWRRSVADYIIGSSNCSIWSKPFQGAPNFRNLVIDLSLFLWWVNWFVPKTSVTLTYVGMSIKIILVPVNS